MKDEGWLYCVSNPAMPGYYKVGFTSDDLEEHLEAIYRESAAIPLRFHVEAAKWVQRVSLKTDHTRKILRMTINTEEVHNSFFKASLDDILQLFLLLDGDDYAPLPKRKPVQVNIPESSTFSAPKPIAIRKSISPPEIPRADPSPSDLSLQPPTQVPPSDTGSETALPDVQNNALFSIQPVEDPSVPAAVAERLTAVGDTLVEPKQSTLPRKSSKPRISLSETDSIIVEPGDRSRTSVSVHSTEDTPAVEDDAAAAPEAPPSSASSAPEPTLAPAPVPEREKKLREAMSLESEMSRHTNDELNSSLPTEALQQLATLQA